MSESTRFNDNEKLVLVQGVVENDHILYGKLKGPGFGGVTTHSKEDCWRTICEKVNAVATVPKTVAQLKKKFSNIKQRGQLKLDEGRKTGGGPKPADPSPAEQLWLDNSTQRPAVMSLGARNLDTDADPEDADDAEMPSMGPQGDAAINDVAGTSKKYSLLGKGPRRDAQRTDENTSSKLVREALQGKGHPKKPKLADLEKENIKQENEKLKAETDKLKAETQKIKQETEYLKVTTMLKQVELQRLALSPTSAPILENILSKK